VPARQKKRGRLWLKDGSGIQLRPEHGNHVWTYDFVRDRAQDGKAIRLLTVVDEFSRECLAIRGGRRWDASDVPSTSAGLFLQHGVPQCLRSDKGSEMTANELLDGEIITTIPEAKVLVKQWRRHTNTVRPHRSLGYRPPALEADPRPPRGAEAWLSS